MPIGVDNNGCFQRETQTVEILISKIEIIMISEMGNNHGSFSCELKKNNIFYGEIGLLMLIFTLKVPNKNSSR